MNQLSDTWVRAAVSDAADGVLVEAAGVIVYVNQAYARLLGYRSVYELLGKGIDSIVHPGDRDRLQHFAKCRRERKPAPMQYTFNALRRDGTPLALQASVSATSVPGELLITTLVRVAAGKTVGAIVMPDLKGLSPRERQVFNHLIEGRRPKEIAVMLDISEKTVGTHASRMYAKLALRNYLDLFKFASHHGLIDARGLHSGQPTSSD